MKIGDKILYLFLFVSIIAGLFLLYRPTAEYLTAEIRYDNELLHEINLWDVKEPYEMWIEYEKGLGVMVRVEQGRIQHLNSTCPDQICVRQGWASRPGQSIVCLPYRIIISIKGTDEAPIDGIVH